MHALHVRAFEDDGGVTTVASGHPGPPEDRPTAEAALAGAGLACMVDGTVAPEIADGRRAFTDRCRACPGFILPDPSRDRMGARLHAFLDCAQTR